MQVDESRSDRFRLVAVVNMRKLNSHNRPIADIGEKGFGGCFANLAYTLGQLEAVLSVALELLNVRASLGLTFLEGIKQPFKFTNAFLRFGLRSDGLLSPDPGN